MNSLDVFTGFLCGGTSLVLFGLHALTAPTAARFFNLPNYVRVGVWLASATLMLRSVELLSLPGKSDTTPGHASVAALIAAALIFYNVGAILIWLVGLARETHAPSGARVTTTRR